MSDQIKGKNEDKKKEGGKRTKSDFSDQFSKANDKIAQNMQYQRLLHHISQKDMAKRLGITREYLSKLERGIYKVPAVIVEKYCQIFKILPDLILDTHIHTDEMDLIVKIMNILTTLPKDVLQTILDMLTAYHEKYS